MDAIKSYPRSVLVGIGAHVCDTAAAYMYATFTVAYATDQLDMSRGVVLGAVVTYGLLVIALQPFFGALSDRIGRRPINLFSVIFTGLWAFPFFALVQTGDPVLVWIALIVAATVGWAPMIAVQPAFYAELFGARVRYTGFATSRELGAAIAGFSPLVATALLGVERRQAVAGGGVLRRAVVDLARRVPVLARDQGRRHGGDRPDPDQAGQRREADRGARACDEPVRLGLQALGEVAGPRVDPQGLEVGIVHLGLGAFHRAHQAVYTEDAMAAEPGPWGICGASRRSRAVVDALTQQDGLYGVLERGPDEDRVRVLGAVREALVATEQPDALRDRLAAAGTHVVTLTVTEAGYPGGPPRRRADLAGGAPRTPVGMLVRGLEARRAAGVDTPLAIVSCDNLPDNGELLRGLVEDFCARAGATASRTGSPPTPTSPRPWSTGSCRPPRRPTATRRAG